MERARRLHWRVALAPAFDIFGGIEGYIVISIIGIVPLLYLWIRGDRGTPLRRAARPVQIPA